MKSHLLKVISEYLSIIMGCPFMDESIIAYPIDPAVLKLRIALLQGFFMQGISGTLFQWKFIYSKALTVLRKDGAFMTMGLNKLPPIKANNAINYLFKSVSSRISLLILHNHRIQMS